MSTAVLPVDDAKALLQRLSGLPNQRSRREFLARQWACLSLDLVIQIADRARELLRVDARESLALSAIAIEIARMLKDELAMAHAIRIKANAEYALGRHPSAVKLYEEAIKLFEAAGDETELGRTLSVSILSLHLCGDYDGAFKAAERARSIFKELGDELRLARLDINLGNVYYRQDRFSEALDCYRRAYRVVLDRHDTEGIGVVLSNLAVCLISVGDFADALQTYQQAREACGKHGMPRLVAQADYNIAYLYYLRGEYSRAIDMLRFTRESCEKVDDRYHHALCNLDLSELYLELNLSEEAAELAKRASAEFELLGLKYEQAKSMAFRAIAMSQQGRSDESVAAFSQSRAIFAQEKNRVWPSLVDLYKALVLFNDGYDHEAGQLAKAALDFFDSSLLPAKAVLCKLLLARIALRTNDISAARGECVAALEMLKETQLPLLKHQAFLLMGHIHSASGNRNDAYSCFRASRHALETLRSNVRGQELKLAFLKNRLEVYEVLVDACLQIPGETSVREAFGYIEEAKSRILMDQMLQPAAEELQDEDVSERARKIANLRNELNWYYSLIELEQMRSEPGSAERLRRLETQVRTRESDLVRALQELSSADAAQVALPEFPSIALHDIREAIDDETLIVEYFQSGDRICACLLDRQRLEILPVASALKVKDVLQMLNFQLSKFRLGSGYTQAFQDSLMHSARSHLRKLYDELLTPIRSRLDTANLLVVPHGVLHYVPFHALFDGAKYLVDDYTVSYAPSASVYSVCVKKNVTRTGSTLLMGIPDKKAPLIENEISSLREILPNAKTYMGASANEETLRSEGRRSLIVHIATHGQFRQDNPIFSSIRLGDSYLSLYDLYRLRLPAELVTLSGCATGLNVIAAGDELIGLARGLLQAGARSLLLSLWDAHDASTTEFMRSFYRHLCRGSARAAAVREAMLEVRQRFPHPYQWAPFVLVGAQGPLPGASGYSDTSKTSSKHF